jgi:hypothetical protein
MSKFTTDYRARGICDRCGFGMRLRELRVLTIKTKNVDLRVCRRCWEKDHPQLRLGSTPVEDVQALRAPRPDFAGYPASREAIVPVYSYLSGSERTFGISVVGFVYVIAAISSTTVPTGVQATSSVGTVTLYTAYGLTSQPYPISYTESTNNTGAFGSGLVYNEIAEATDNTSAFISGTLFNTLVAYNNYADESTDNTSDFISGTLLNVLVSYNNYAAESTDNSSAFISGTLQVMPFYNNYAAESTDNTSAFISGVLV